MFRFRFGTRLATVGTGAAFLVGCHSVEPPAPLRPPVKQVAAIYPGIAAPASSGLVSPASGVVQADGSGIQQAAADDAHPAESTIDLDVALRLAGVENPTINLAREVVREALAEQLAARALLLPSVNIGGNFRQHRGALLASPGYIRNVDLQSLYLGAGSGVLGTGTPAIPGVRLFAHLGDAAYEPLAARQRVNVRQGESQAVQNGLLLEVATGYLGLVGAEVRRDILRRGEADLAEITRLTAVNAKAGQGRHADANRTEANLDLIHTDMQRAEEEIAVANARLCRLLNLDPSNRLRTPGGSVQPLRLIPEDSEAEGLVTEALRSRPEIFARSAAIAEAQTRVRQERVRPWLPTVSVGYSYGGFGGGSNLAPTEFGPLSGRSELDVIAVWSFQNLGVGNQARVRAANSGVGTAIAGYDLIANQIRREVAEALADAQAAATQIKTVESSLAPAEEGFKLEMERIKQGQGRPIEVLDSFRQLLESRQEMLRAVIAFDIAQFRLFVAVGSNPLAGPPAPAAIQP
ncbi:MAG: TolC family protein [Planctomycetes bacterium]|nr:TolC family protein [Planctomycetota bacterium]